MALETHRISADQGLSTLMTCFKPQRDLTAQILGSLSPSWPVVGHDLYFKKMSNKLLSNIYYLMYSYGWEALN